MRKKTPPGEVSDFALPLVLFQNKGAAVVPCAPQNRGYRFVGSISIEAEIREPQDGCVLLDLNRFESRCRSTIELVESFGFRQGL